MSRLVCAVGVALFLVSSASAAKPASRCQPARSQPVTGSDKVAVYTRNYFAYVCAYKTGKTRRLGDSGFENYSFTATGRYVAYVRSIGGSGVPRQQVILVDGVTRKRIDVGVAGCGGGPVGIEDFAVTRTGAVVWACSAYGMGVTSAKEIHRHDTCGDALLDQSFLTAPYAAVAPPSTVAISASRRDAQVAYWTIAGRTGSAPLDSC